MKTLRALLGAALLMTTACHAADRNALYARALERYANGEYAAAYAGFGAAADAGHGRAQEIAGLMGLLGPSMYGAAVAHDTVAAVRRLQQAAESGSEVGRHVVCARARRNTGPPCAGCAPR